MSRNLSVSGDQDPEQSNPISRLISGGLVFLSGFQEILRDNYLSFNRVSGRRFSKYKSEKKFQAVIDLHYRHLFRLITFLTA